MSWNGNGRHQMARLTESKHRARTHAHAAGLIVRGRPFRDAFIIQGVYMPRCSCTTAYAPDLRDVPGRTTTKSKVGRGAVIM